MGGESQWEVGSGKLAVGVGSGQLAVGSWRPPANRRHRSLLGGAKTCWLTVRNARLAVALFVSSVPFCG